MKNFQLLMIINIRRQFEISYLFCKHFVAKEAIKFEFVNYAIDIIRKISKTNLNSMSFEFE